MAKVGIDKSDRGWDRQERTVLASKAFQVDADAGAQDPVALARSLLLLKEGAIVTAHLGHEADPAGDAKAAAEELISVALVDPYI